MRSRAGTAPGTRARAPRPHPERSSAGFAPAARTQRSSSTARWVRSIRVPPDPFHIPQDHAGQDRTHGAECGHSGIPAASPGAPEGRCGAHLRYRGGSREGPGPELMMGTDRDGKSGMSPARAVAAMVPTALCGAARWEAALAAPAPAGFPPATLVPRGRCCREGCRETLQALWKRQGCPSPPRTRRLPSSKHQNPAGFQPRSLQTLHEGCPQSPWDSKPQQSRRRGTHSHCDCGHSALLGTWGNGSLSQPFPCSHHRRQQPQQQRHGQHPNPTPHSSAAAS